MVFSDDGRAVRFAPAGPGPMKCLAICQDELVIRVLDEILLPSFEIEFLVESASLARRMTEAGVHITAGDLKRKDTFHKADISPSTCVIVQDTGKRGLKKVLENIRDAGGTLIYVLGVGVGASAEREEEVRNAYPDVTYLAMAELFGGPLLTEFGRSLTRARVQQYQRYFADAEKVLIMLHNDPDPDAMARAWRSEACSAAPRRRRSSARFRASRVRRTCAWRTCSTSTSSR